MAIGVVELASVSRIQDYSTIKQNEDNKGYVDQSAIGQQVLRNQEHQMKEVTGQQNADYYDRPFDASEKGDNEYEKRQMTKKNKKKKVEQIVVNGYHGFDIKI